LIWHRAEGTSLLPFPEKFFFDLARHIGDRPLAVPGEIFLDLARSRRKISKACGEYIKMIGSLKIPSSPNLGCS
jgi:hypothetical protein